MTLPKALLSLVGMSLVIISSVISCCRKADLTAQVSEMFSSAPLWPAWLLSAFLCSFRQASSTVPQLCGHPFCSEQAQ